jgi:glutamyl-tRNA synthetase
MVLLGWSLDDQTDVMSLEVIKENFSLERVGKPAAIFDIERLQWMNGVYIRQLPPEELADRMMPFLEGDLPPELLPVDRGYLLRIVPLVQERLKLLSESARLTSYFFAEKLEYETDLIQRGMDRESTLKALEQIEAKLAASEDFSHEHLEQVLRQAGEELGLRPREFLGILRVAVTGRTASPPLFETLEVLGCERVLERVRTAIERLTTA